MKYMDFFKVTRNDRFVHDDKWSYDYNTKTFTSVEENLCITAYLPDMTFNIGNYCKIITSQYNVVNAGSHCKIRASNNNEIYTGPHCDVYGEFDCIFNVGHDSRIETSGRGLFTTKENCMVSVTSFFTNQPYYKHIDVNKYLIPELMDFSFKIKDYEQLHNYDLDNPRLLILHTKNDLGKRLFNHYKNKGLL